MARGSKTPLDRELAFRQHYLITGNVAAASREAGLPTNTGYEVRDRLLVDPTFIQARDRIREKVEQDAEQMAVTAMQLCLERLGVDPDKRVDKLMRHAGKGGRVQFQDPGPQYAASLAKLMQAVNGLRRFEAERKGEVAPVGTVNINVTGPAGAQLGDGTGQPSG